MGNPRLMRYSITIHFQKCAEWARQACWSVAAYFDRPQNRDKSNQIKVRLWDNQRVNRDHAATRTGRSSDIQAIKVTVHLLLCLVLLLKSSFLARGSQESIEHSRFKAFLTDPKQIAELVFQRSDYPELPPHEMSGVYFKDAVYSVMWQKTAFCITQIIPENFAVTNSGMIIHKKDLGWIYGATASEIWYARAETFTYYKGAIQDKDIGLPIHDNARDYQNKALEVIHLGIANLCPGSFKWLGNEWEGVDLSGAKITGTALFDASNNRPDRLEYKVEGSRVRFKVEYIYDSKPNSADIESGLPNHFRRVQISANPAESPDLVEADFKIQKLVVSSSSIEQLVMEKEVQERMRIESIQTAPIFEAKTNGTWYLNRDGQRSLVEKNATVHLPGDSERSKPYLVRSILLLFGIGGLIFIYVRTKRSK